MLAPRLWLAVPLVSWWLAPVPLAQSVWTVDAAGGGDFTTIQAAVDAASDGDLVLVRPAPDRYAPFVIDGKGLSILGDGGAPRIGGQFLGSGSNAIRNVPADSYVVLRGITLARNTHPIESNDGVVWLEECTAELPVTGLTMTLEVEQSESVVLARCDFTQPNPSVHINSPIVHGVDSGLIVHASVFDWEVPNCTNWDIFGAGLAERCAGIRLQDSTLFLGGSRVVGQMGTQSSFVLRPCDAASDGGDGLIVDAGSFAEGCDSTLQGGAPGLNSPGECSPVTHCGSDAAPGQDVVGTYDDLGASFRSLTAASPALAKGSTALRFEGEPGDLAFLNVGVFPGSTRYPTLSGYSVIGPLQEQIVVGYIPPSGFLEVELPLGPLPLGVHVAPLFLQSYVIDSRGRMLLGGASAVHVLSHPSGPFGELHRPR